MKIESQYKVEGCASKDPTRVHLCAPWLDTKAGKVIATNGHAMAVVPVTVEPSDVDGPISGDALKDLRKRMRTYTEATLAAGPDSLRVIDAAGDAPTFPRNKDAHFVPWEVVLPNFGKDGPRATIGIDVGLLAQVAKAIGADRGVGGVVKLEIGGELDAIRVTCGNDAVGVLMPCRV